MVVQPPSPPNEAPLLNESPFMAATPRHDPSCSKPSELISILFEQYRHRAVAYAQRLVGNSDGEDVVQEIFLKFTRCRSLTPAHINAPFILAATRNAAMTFLKRRSMERKHCTQANELRSMSSHMEHGSDRRVDENLLEDLTEGQREVLILVEVMGLTETQASVALDISRPVVHAKKFAAVRSLRARFVGDDDAATI